MSPNIASSCCISHDHDRPDNHSLTTMKSTSPIATKTPYGTALSVPEYPCQIGSSIAGIGYRYGLVALTDRVRNGIAKSGIMQPPIDAMIKWKDYPAPATPSFILPSKLSVICTAIKDSRTDQPLLRMTRGTLKQIVARPRIDTDCQLGKQEAPRPHGPTSRHSKFQSGLIAGKATARRRGSKSPS